jgi:hypothetical protein
MKNITGIPNLSKKKDQLIMKTTLIHILSDSNNRITRVELHNEIEEVPYDDLFDSRLTKRFTGRKTITIELYNDSTNTPTTTGTAKGAKDSD